MSRRKRTPRRRGQEDLAAQYRQEGQLRDSIRTLERKAQAFVLDAEYRKQCGALAEHLTRAEAILKATTETAGCLVAENVALHFQVGDLRTRLAELGAHRKAGTTAPAARIKAERIADDLPHSRALQEALDMHAVSRQKQLYAAEPSTAVTSVLSAAGEVRQYLQVLMEGIASIVKLSSRITQLAGDLAIEGAAAAVADAESRCQSLEPALRRRAEDLEDLIRQHSELATTRDQLLSAVKGAEGR